MNVLDDYMVDPRLPQARPDPDAGRAELHLPLRLRAASL